MDFKKVFSTDNIDKKIFDDRWVRFAFGPQGKIFSDKLNLGIVEFESNTISNPHTHDVDEALYVISGNAEFRLGKDNYKIKKDDFIYIPKNTEHKVITADRKIRILFIFAGNIKIDD